MQSPVTLVYDGSKKHESSKQLVRISSLFIEVPGRFHKFLYSSVFPAMNNAQNKYPFVDFVLKYGVKSG